MFQDFSLIYYKCNTASITRVSKDGISKFYYGILSKDSIQNERNYIKAEYSGFNNNMDVYLIFKKNNDVELVHYGGEFFSYVGIQNKSFYFTDFDNEVYDIKLETSLGNCNCAIRVFDNIDREKMWTADSHTSVQVEYK